MRIYVNGAQGFVSVFLNEKARKKFLAKTNVTRKVIFLGITTSQSYIIRM